jgi:4-aminobutyrate aminotransferase / (S)-3-amino-2-methylpropionate transaminase / 5-aminovalerate transaminase
VRASCYATKAVIPQVVTAIPGPESRRLSAEIASLECPAFDERRAGRAQTSGEEQGPIVYARGVGSTLVDVDGNTFVDLTAGFGALALGHCPPRLTEALHEQQATLGLALGDVYGSTVKAQAMAAIAALFPSRKMRVMLGTSGADAVTAALKTAMLATNKPGVLAFEGGYHGLSHGPLASCGLASSFRQPFQASLNQHSVFCKYPVADVEVAGILAQVRQKLAAEAIGAVLVEPILGRGGCLVPPSAFLPELRQVASEAGALLIVDEVWTGLGRAGAWVQPISHEADLVCFGKALGAGVPVSACVGTETVMQAWSRHGGSAIHTATHFGSPLASRAVLVSLEEIKIRHLDVEARRKGEELRVALASHVPVTGVGLMLGLHLPNAAEALAVARRLLRRGYIVLTGGVFGNVITLTPALTIESELLLGFVQAFIECQRADGA